MNKQGVAAPPADYNARILHPIAQWLRDQHGVETLNLTAAGANLDPNQLGGTTEWISQEQLEAFLEGARALMPSDEVYNEACVYRMAEGYGPMRYVLWAASPSLVYSHAVDTYKLVSTIGVPKVLSIGRTATTIRIESDRLISRLNCLLRQAQTAFLPRLWGLPNAVVRETACSARGDGACEYHLRYFDRRRWLPTLLGTAVGGAVAAASIHFGLEAAATVALPFLGGAVGFALEQQRTGRANIEVGDEQNQALRALAEQEAEIRRELLAMHQRQRQWTRMLESEATERAASIQTVVERIHRTQEVRDRQLRGFSHDLRSPLAVMQMGAEYFGEHATRIGGEAPQVAEELEDAIQRMHRMLSELMEAATAQAALPQLTPETIDVESLTERLRRRLRAMVYGRDIRVSVFRTREAPDSIHIDPLLLDRITDNLLSNAAKYTERGSIVLELEGSPGFLVLKISDSGRGIDGDDIARAFEPGGSEKTTRANGSYGIGLSVVVQLLGQLGGRLEVMSKPGVGTTFWVYLPVKARIVSANPRVRDEGGDDLVNKVVKIRRVKSA